MGDKLQYKLSLKSLVESSGMKVFKEDLDDLKGYAEAQLAMQDSKGFISSDGLCQLNFNKGYKAGLQSVLSILRGYEDELVGSDVKQTKVKE